MTAKTLTIRRNRCRLDEQKVCLGCFRHVEDIREWRSADDDRRRVICAQAERRKAHA